jgi:hypothetical protein
MFSRAPTFHVDAYICGLRIFLYRRSCFLDLEYFMSADILINADILGRRHFNKRRHFRAPTF